MLHAGGVFVTRADDRDLRRMSGANEEERRQ
jgi:hypothetical protein